MKTTQEIKLLAPTKELLMIEAPKKTKAPEKIKYDKPDVLKPRSKFKYAMIVRKLEQAFSIGCTVSEACVYADISRNTYYRWIENNETLKDRFEALLEKPSLKARQTVVNGLGDVDVAKWYLERKVKKEFSTRQEVTGEGGKPIRKEIIIKIENFANEPKHQPNISKAICGG